MADWKCPRCRRVFTRKNQRHACGTGDRKTVLRDRPAELHALYESIEKYVQSLGSVEVVARERYILLRTKRIFADIVVMKDVLRIAVHLARRVDEPMFFKIAQDARHVTHVAKLQKQRDMASLRRYLKEAYEHSLR